jgi:hypothetical protein
MLKINKHKFFDFLLYKKKLKLIQNRIKKKKSINFEIKTNT